MMSILFDIVPRIAPMTVQEEALKITGRVHSMETFSTVDGHGIRVICFLQVGDFLFFFPSQ